MKLTREQEIEAIMLFAEYCGTETTRANVEKMPLNEEYKRELADKYAKLKKAMEPVRCKIVEPTSEPQPGGIQFVSPDKAKPHVGKLGWCTPFGPTVKIKLDDGTVLFGYECWWKEV